MKQYATLSITLLCASLASCKSPAKTTPETSVMVDSNTVIKPLSPSPVAPDNHPHALRGTVDSLTPLTIEDVAKLGVAEAKKRYLGKVVTFKGLNPVGVRAKNENEKNVCMQGFGKWLSPAIGQFQHGGIDVFFNFADEITEWDHEGEYRPQNLKVDNLRHLDEDVCDTARVCNEGDVTTERRCIFSSERFLIAGKVIWVGTNGSGKGFRMDIRPTGVRY